MMVRTLQKANCPGRRAQLPCQTCGTVYLLENSRRIRSLRVPGHSHGKQIFGICGMGGTGVRADKTRARIAQAVAADILFSVRLMHDAWSFVSCFD
ncbi:MAG: hypothetical protein GX417_04080 [Clostridiales bacterium]|nr:hypothetical protein [Clostridiales bacterium]